MGDQPPLSSSKSIPAHERLIVALDVPGKDAALALVDQLGDSVAFYKLGLELFMAGDYYPLLEELLRRGKKAFIDLKFFDVPETVAAAVREVRDRGVTFVTVHGQDAALRAAAREKGDVKILAVTVLTSLDQGDVEAFGFPVDVRKLVLSRAQRALAAGCDGVISSGLEAPLLRAELGDRFLVVAPGIRPVTNDDDPAWQHADDQKRVATVEEAFRNGADYIVVGRPVRNAADPRAAAEAIQDTIGGLFNV